MDKLKSALVTGAGSGIGAASARLLAGRGYHVTCADLNAAAAVSVAADIAANSGSAQAVPADVSDYAAFEGLVHIALEYSGKLDLLVNNAGIGPAHMLRTAEHRLDDWERVIAVNQSSVFYGMKLALAHMAAQGGGNIVNVASLAGIKASGNNLSYVASKSAVIGMTRAAALEYAAKNIRINAVCPGYTQSALLDRLLSTRPGMDDLLLGFIPMKRFGRPEEIAEAIAWLASDAASFITGHCLVLDGGTSL